IDMGWSIFTGTYTKLSSEVAMDPVTMQTADEAYDLILEQAGAFYWDRDSVDTRLFDVNIPNLTGMVIDSQNEVGGYPVITYTLRPTDWDTDSDGMPNWWELAYGLDPNVMDNNGYLLDPNYTNLEVYIDNIPEPTTLGLLAIGIFGLLGRRGLRRRRD
ncbi:MAG: PEP-CTERM sorting domain-containing protein, partial [Alphaproteobacteria bacterium]